MKVNVHSVYAQGSYDTTNAQFTEPIIESSTDFDSLENGKCCLSTKGKFCRSLIKLSRVQSFSGSASESVLVLGQLISSPS